MGQRFTIERELSKDDRDAFDKYLRDELPTADEATDWVQAHGYTKIHRSCVYGYMSSPERLIDDVKSASEASAALVGGAEDVAAIDAATRTIMKQGLQSVLIKMVREGTVNTKDLANVALILNRDKRTEAVELAIREQERKRSREQAAEAVAAAEKVAKNGDGAAAVVAKVREIMGIPG